MNALTTTTTFCPSSFQLKFALGGRRCPLAFARVRFPAVGRRRRVKYVSLVVRSSAANGGNGLERNSSGKSSADGFSGWFDADRQSSDPKPKRSLADILGEGVAGVVLVSGMTFAALLLFMSKKSTSVVRKDMVPVITIQEVSFSYDDSLNQAEEGKNGAEVGMLESSSEESKTGTNGDHSLCKENSEAIEGRISDDTDVRQSSEGGDVYIPEALQRESATGDNLVSLEAADKPPSPDITGGSLALPSIQSNNGNITSENPSEPAAEKLADTKILEQSVFDTNSENLVTENPNGMSSSNEWENTNLPSDPSSLEPSLLNNLVKSESDAVIESSSIHEEFIESGSVFSTRDVQQSKDLLTSDADLNKLFEVYVDGDDKSPVGKNLNGTASAGAPLVPEVPYKYGNEHLENDYNVTQFSFDSTNLGKTFSSAGIPAPSVVSAALQSPPGKVLVPAVIDQLQSQALSALQVLKVIEDDVQAGDLCTRREYARWLVLASSALSRNTTSKVYPAMYIENVSELAFDDITPEDPDFPSIQGLAEAGLIASKLSRRDMQPYGDEDSSPLYFSPESRLSRQDLVSWKMALEKRQLPVVDKKILQQVSGFIDIDKIDPDAWPALVADLAAEEQGIITLAFGYTRLFQPEKPVTKAQAAIALSTGDAYAIVSEELARIEAESMAEKAVTAHSALVAQVEKDLNARYEKELLLENEKITAVEKMAEEAIKEVEKLRSAREEESLSLMKERAAVDSEMELLSRLRREVEEQLQTLLADKLQISNEKEKMNKLRRDAETENQEIERLLYELEVERKALAMARAWAEDEAKRAREQVKALDEARDRWDKQGIKVVVDNDLRQEEADSEATWLAVGNQFSDKVTNEESDDIDIEEELNRIADEWREFQERIKKKFEDRLHKIHELISKIIEKIVLLISNLKEKVIELKDGAQRNSTLFISTATERTKRVAGEWKEGVERFSQKFKT